MEYKSHKSIGKVIRNLVSAELCEFVTREIRLIDQHIKYSGNGSIDQRHPESTSLYSPFCTEILSTMIQDKIESSLDRKIIPSYSYCRIYRTGASLHEHLDRRASEYTLSIALEDKDDIKWPICAELHTGEVVSAKLDVGDAILYSGRDQMHWRPGVFKGKEIVQAFLQYIDADGDSTDLAFDGRPLLAFPFESTDPSLDHNMDRKVDEEKIKRERLTKPK